MGFRCCLPAGVLGKRKDELEKPKQTLHDMDPKELHIRATKQAVHGTKRIDYVKAEIAKNDVTLSATEIEDRLAEAVAPTATPKQRRFTKTELSQRKQVPRDSWAPSKDKGKGKGKGKFGDAKGKGKGKTGKDSGKGPTGGDGAPKNFRNDGRKGKQKGKSADTKGSKGGKQV